jgi:peptidoglycan/xylan/chitin deacetylase (PgdA/CDA1 family)
MDHDFRDLDVESVYEYGSRAGVWRLLRLFEEYAIRVTFFAAAVALERNPTVGQYIERAGHEPCSHGWRWEEPWRLERDEERQHIQWAIESFQDTCGQRPVGWFSRYSPSVNTRDLLVEEGGFLYDSDAFNDDLPYFTQVNGAEHLIVPYTHVYNDGRYAIAPHIGGPSDFVDICKRGMSELRREGHIGHPKMMSIGLHPRWAGQAARTSAVREVIEYALELSDIWIATRRDIAEWWIDHHEEF